MIGLLLLSWILRIETVHAVPPDEATAFHCFKSEDFKGSKTDRKYQGFRDLFTKNKVRPAEILGRLIYSETKAAGGKCKDMEGEILQHIASALENRIRKRNDDILSVIFEPSQFASSLHFYKESAVNHFLCPTASPMWEQAMRFAREIADKSYKNTLSKDAVNYYLYKHSTRFKPPAWTKSLKDVTPSKKQISECIRFFDNPNF